MKTNKKKPEKENPEIQHELKTQPDYRELFGYFIPLAFQAISQSFTYPLVAIVAARGEGGAINIAAMAQSHILLFFLASFGAGLITAGMVYCTNAEGLIKFRKLNRYFALLITASHAFICIPPVAKLVFSSIMGLSDELYKPTYLAFLLSLPFPLLFNLRNVAMVVLFKEKSTGKAFSATLARISGTVILAIMLTAVGKTGIVWAVICQTVPILFEIVLMKYHALPLEKHILSKKGKSASISEMAVLTGSFSAGKILISFSAYSVAGFAARAADPEIMLPVYYAASGLMNPFAFAASRIQAAVITFAQKDIENCRLLHFTVICGLICGFVPIIFTAPFLSEFYYVTLQKIPLQNLSLIRQTALVLLFVPFAVALRAYVEGLAAFSRKPVAVIAGQGVYFGAVVSAAFFAFNLGTPGNLIGPFALFAGNIGAAAILYLALKIKDEKIDSQTAQVIQQ